MSRAGTRILGDNDYLDPDERKREAKSKRRDLRERGLTPDLFIKQTELCLPPGMKVGIIGAGFAGLAVAWYLKECGLKAITVYEATSAVGGRVRTDRSFVPGKIVEAGAELIGENHPLWGELASPSRFNLKLVELTDDSFYEGQGFKVQTRFRKVDLTKDEKEQLRASLRGPLAKIGAEAERISETLPWRSGGAQDLDNKPVAKRLDELVGTASASPFARPWLDFTLENDNCIDVCKQSYLGLLAAVSAARMGNSPKGMLGYWMSTETHRCVGGNDLLAAAIASGISDLRPKTTVERVSIEEVYAKPVRVLSAERDENGTVTKRQTDDFDYVVLTVPPTVWNLIKFNPQFDPAQRGMQQGPSVKFLSLYETRSWESAQLIPPGMSQALAPTAKWDELGSVWEGTDNQGTKPEFDLTVFSGGSFVQLPAQYSKMMSTLYPAAKAKVTRMVDWTKEPFIETGYAVPGLRQITTVSPNQIVPHMERLYFAGEHTSPGFFGYMEGALQSGARAARDIVKVAAIRCRTGVVQ